MRQTSLQLGALLLLSSSSLGCGNSHNKNASAAVAGSSANVAGSSAQAGQAGDGAVVCGGAVCGVPDMAFGADVKSTGLDIRPCCAQNVCGLRVVGSAAIRDICVPIETSMQPTTGCPSYFDKPLNVYKWGCCLPDGMCGELWNGVERFGCSDPRLTSMTEGHPTMPCQPGVPCTVMHSPCTRNEDCCAIPPLGSSCVAFSGTDTVCAPLCEVDSDCGTQCCRPTQNGLKACAPIDMCSQP